MQTDQHHEQDELMARSKFPRSPEAIGPARVWATRAYRRVAGGSEAQAETLALLVSELATNAVLHTVGANFEITVWPEHVIEVRDYSREKPAARVAGDDDEGGRGLTLVTALSKEFEVIPVDDGKIIRIRLYSG